MVNFLAALKNTILATRMTGMTVIQVGRTVGNPSSDQPPTVPTHSQNLDDTSGSQSPGNLPSTLNSPQASNELHQPNDSRDTVSNSQSENHPHPPDDPHPPTIFIDDPDDFYSTDSDSDSSNDSHALVRLKKPEKPNQDLSQGIYPESSSSSSSSSSDPDEPNLPSANPLYERLTQQVHPARPGIPSAHTTLLKVPFQSGRISLQLTNQDMAEHRVLQVTLDMRSSRYACTYAVDPKSHMITFLVTRPWSIPGKGMVVGGRSMDFPVSYNWNLGNVIDSGERTGVWVCQWPKYQKQLARDIAVGAVDIYVEEDDYWFGLE